VALTFFTDHCVPPQAGEVISQSGHRVVLLRDVMPHDSPDDAVLAKAQELGAILVSLNGDFADIVRYPPSLYGGIVALQIKGHPQSLSAILDTLEAYVRAHGEADDYSGTLLLVEPHRIRTRK
jgi:hypothetical protein